MRKFWQGKKVFLTGHTGFKGGWLALWLTTLGADVTGYALPPEHPKGCYRVFRLAERLHSLEGDIRDRQKLDDALRATQPEIVFHLAAQPLVRASYRDPIETYAVNVLGTAQLLDALRTIPTVKAVVVVTTDKCYENQEKEAGYVESDPLGGFDPYACSKACAELVTASYRDAFLQELGVAVATARAGNVIGGGDWAEDRLLPDLMRGVLNRETVLLRYPQAIRPWQHVLDTLSGYLRLAQTLWETPQKAVSAWNFGPTEKSLMTVSQIAKTISERWPGRLIYREAETAQPHETTVLILNAQKAITQLGWQPRLNLEEALNLTVEWYRVLFEHADVLALSEKQIGSYMENTFATAPPTPVAAIH